MKSEIEVRKALKFARTVQDKRSIWAFTWVLDELEEGWEENLDEDAIGPLAEEVPRD
jgi:translation elongation factor EF-1alpha